MQKELKPCPFCGKQPELITQHDEKAEYWVIRCCNIDDFASWSNLEEIIEKWNTRHYSDVMCSDTKEEHKGIPENE